MVKINWHVIKMCVLLIIYSVITFYVQTNKSHIIMHKQCLHSLPGLEGIETGKVLADLSP